MARFGARRAPRIGPDDEARIVADDTAAFTQSNVFRQRRFIERSPSGSRLAPKMLSRSISTTKVGLRLFETKVSLSTMRPITMLAVPYCTPVNAPGWALSWFDPEVFSEEQYRAVSQRVLYGYVAPAPTEDPSAACYMPGTTEWDNTLLGCRGNAAL